MEFTLEKLEVYNIAEKFSDDIWDIVINWDYFKKDTIGKQLVELQIQFLQILQKVMGAISIKKANSFIFIPEDQFRTQNRCYRNV
jgi:hypothetical protein